MEEANKFFNKLLDSEDDLNIAKLGKIVKIHDDYLTADIQALPSESNPLVLQVPLMIHQTENSFIYTPYKEGDLVLLVFVDYNIDNILLESDNLASDIKHSTNDCICVGKVGTINKLPPINNPKGITIKSGKSKIELAENGDITISGNHIQLEADRIDLN